MTVGCVPYVNARPLVHWLESLGDRSPVQVQYRVPSLLPAMLESGEAAAVMVSSIEAISHPGRRIAEGLCIASDGVVESVRLFSKVPFSEIKSLALDQSSLTSNALAQIILAEVYGVKPISGPMLPDQAQMLTERDACVLIGDIGMGASSEGLHVLDLGEAWTKLTGLPFVWALWVGSDSLTPELSALLGAARLMSFVGRNPDSGMQQFRRALYSEWVNDLDPRRMPDGFARRDEVVAAAADRSGWDREDARRYLTETIVYDLGARALEGLKLYGEKAVQHKLIDQAFSPELIAPQLHPARTPI